jgi:hypothetical protein
MSAEHADVIDAMVSYITRHPGTSFVELERIAEEHGITASGDLSLEVCPNGVLWAGISADFADVLDALQADGRVTIDSLDPTTALLVYACDGKMLNLPVAQRAPRDLTKGYAKPRWMAATFGPADGS